MKTFKQHMTEAKSATLYHGTGFDNIHNILKSGHIATSDNGRVSTSRDRKFIESGHGSEAYLHIDQEKLAHNQKITPTDWHGGGSIPDKHSDDSYGLRDHRFRRSEAEESIKGKVSLKHVKAITIHKKHWDELTGPKTDSERETEKDIKDNPESKWMFRGLTRNARLKRAKRFHDLLAKHPHIKLHIKDY